MEQLDGEGLDFFFREPSATSQKVVQRVLGAQLHYRVCHAFEDKIMVHVHKVRVTEVRSEDGFVVALSLDISHCAQRSNAMRTLARLNCAFKATWRPRHRTVVTSAW